MNSKNLAIVFSVVMVLSSFVGCIESEDDASTDTTTDASSLGNVMVSTYHVAELARAVGGDRVTVEIISPSNVPVHDYEPSAADLIRLQETDLFFYHGLNLEPWVDSTISSLGTDAPLAVQTHTMPSGEETLDYESLLLDNICEKLNEGPIENIALSEYEHKASDVTIHAEPVNHKISFPEDDHDGHDHDEHGDEDDHDGHDHDEHGDDHEGHNHAGAEKVIEAPTGCPTDTLVSIFHLEEGEYVLEFEYSQSEDFDMVVLKMPGSHAHHDHHGHEGHSDEDDDHDGHSDDEDDHDHDENEEDHCEDVHEEEGHDGHRDEDEHDHSDEDDHDEHDGHEESEEISAACVLEEFDTNQDSHLSWDEFWHAWTDVENDEDDHDHGDGEEDHGDDEDDHDHGDGEDDHDDDEDDHDHGDGEEDNSTEEEMAYLMELFNEADEDNDELLNLTELDNFIHMVGSDNHAAYATIHIEEEGDYGFALSPGIEFFILMDEDAHEGHNHGAHEGGVCHNTDTHENYDSTEEECGAAGHMWLEEEGHDDHDSGVCHNTDSHENYNSTEADCEAAGHMWMEEHEEDEHDSHNEELEYDPHSWLNPMAFKAQMNIVLEALVTAFPTGEADFRANAKAYASQLDSLDADFKDKFGEGGSCTSNKKVVANHNAYAYLAERYDIEFVTIHGIDPEGEPSAEDIAEAVEEINEEGLTVIYIEEYTDETAVASIAEQTGVTVEILYTMELPPKDSEDNYLSLMQKNLDNLVSGMGC